VRHLRLDTSKPEVYLASWMADDDLAFLLASRTEPSPLPPSDPGAPDNNDFKLLKALAQCAPSYIQLGIWHTDKLVGKIGLAPREKSRADIDYEIIAQYRRNGYASDALRTMADFAINDRRFKTPTLYIKHTNYASQGVAHAVGFELEDKFATFGMYSRLADR
jgi:RimJ/RimL family protein N-acetyltransferase